jgi:hypothetical protein
MDLNATVSRACRLATSLGFGAVKYRESWTAPEIMADLDEEMRLDFELNFSVITDALTQKIDSIAVV